jgi:hypothetical protein
MRISFAAFMLMSSSYLSNDTVKAITEDMDAISMRDAGASKERPRLDG